MILFKVATSKDNLFIFSFLLFLIFSFFFISSALGQGFAPKVDYATTDPVSVFAADLDGDADNDLAVANYGSNTVSVFKNNGDGTFAAKVDYGTGFNPYSVFVSDLDGDTDNDLAVANSGSNTISVFKNNGVGTFAAKVDYGTGATPISVFAADLDGDTDNDLAVANYDGTIVSVLKNNGDGTFAPKVDYGTGTGPYSVFASDLDGDADKDLAVANRDASTVSVLKNNEDGTFALKVDYATGVQPLSVFAADLDGDGDNDLAVASFTDSTVSVLKNNGDGTFALKVDYGTGAGPHSVFASDLDGDTDKDLAVTNDASSTVSVLKNLTLPPPVDTLRNHFMTWHLEGGFCDCTVFVEDQFMKDSLHLLLIESLSNPARKDTSDIKRPNDHLTWYRGEGKAISVNVDYSNQFESTNVFIDSVKYLLLPTQKDPHPQPDSLLGHYTAYKIRNPKGFKKLVQIQDQFLLLVTDSLVPRYFLTPAQKNDEPRFDPDTHYVAYEIFPKSFLGGSAQIFDQFGLHFVARFSIGLLLVPTRKDTFVVCTHKPNDCNGDGTITLPDIICDVNVVFKGFPKPVPNCRCDSNGDGVCTLPDIVYKVNYVFKGGPVPIKSGVCCL